MIHLLVNTGLFPDALAQVFLLIVKDHFRQWHRASTFLHANTFCCES
ncbi:unnamed protein product [Brugia timori]|uniref:Uncharacterized protein n=1 Tax=Brugia timori TaxID=42155 RepID=A0A3P7W2C2_9BILA|nr:unnamed protein product [Brugia timori]